MKVRPFVFVIAFLLLPACVQQKYSETELRLLLVGSWNTSTSFETKEADTRIGLKAHGKTTFNEDGTLIAETENIMDINVPEGQLQIEYNAVVQGRWSISNQTLQIVRISEEITPQDDLSQKFLEHERMTKLRAESPTNFVYSLESVSSKRIVALDSHGSRTSFTRE